MSARDRAPRAGHREVVDRLAALLLAGERPGWVPAQRSTPPAPDDASRLADDPTRSPDALPLRAGPRDAGPFGSVATGSAPTSAQSSGALMFAALADRLPPWAQDRLAGSGTRTALTALVVVGVLGFGGLALLRSQGGASAYPIAAASADPVTTGAAAALPGPADQSSGSIVVDVSGRVRKPGLVTLPSGARVADAITAAGGPTRPRDVRSVDLAAKVGDGQLLMVGESGTPAAAATGSTTGAATTGPIDLSSATVEQLETIPGVGPVTAQKIIDFRSAHNGFSSVSQLQQVSGIGPAKYAEISPLVTS